MRASSSACGGATPWEAEEARPASNQAEQPVPGHGWECGLLSARHEGPLLELDLLYHERRRTMSVQALDLALEAPLVAAA